MACVTHYCWQCENAQEDNNPSPECPMCGNRLASRRMDEVLPEQDAPEHGRTNRPASAVRKTADAY